MLRKIFIGSLLVTGNSINAVTSHSIPKLDESLDKPKSITSSTGPFEVPVTSLPDVNNYLEKELVSSLQPKQIYTRAEYSFDDKALDRFTELLKISAIAGMIAYIGVNIVNIQKGLSKFFKKQTNHVGTINKKPEKELKSKPSKPSPISCTAKLQTALQHDETKEIKHENDAFIGFKCNMLELTKTMLSLYREDIDQSLKVDAFLFYLHQLNVLSLKHFKELSQPLVDGFTYHAHAVSDEQAKILFAELQHHLEDLLNDTAIPFMQKCKNLIKEISYSSAGKTLLAWKKSQPLSPDAYYALVKNDLIPEIEDWRQSWVIDTTQDTKHMEAALQRFVVICARGANHTNTRHFEKYPDQFESDVLKWIFRAIKLRNAINEQGSVTPEKVAALFERSKHIESKYNSTTSASEAMLPAPAVRPTM